MTSHTAIGPSDDPIPGPDQCHRLMQRMQMRSNIVDHSRQVCRVAEFLTDSLMAAGLPLNRRLATAGALLHDITKTRSLETGENHAATGGVYLAELGYRRVAEIVRQHVRLDRYADNGHPGEAEVVNYADKRVLHDTITDLKARMTYIQERYGTTRQHRDRIAVLWQTTLELEARLFARLPFGPEALVEKMSLGTRDENPLNRVS
jgi:putative nucleotidyltransferase with HDIG domain